MGFFDRLANVWRGFLSLWVSDIESRNPEAVYEAAIDELHASGICGDWPAMVPRRDEDESP